MRIMAFDYGVKRIGVAVTDPLQLISSALTTVHPDDIWRFLADYLEVEAVETFVVGKPLQMDGTASESAQHVVGFVRKLKKHTQQFASRRLMNVLRLKWHLLLLRKVVKQRKKRQEKGLVDTISATLILQTYMESKSMM